MQQAGVAAHILQTVQLQELLQIISLGIISVTAEQVFLQAVQALLRRVETENRVL